MVSKRWQKKKLAVYNAGLAAMTLVTVLVLESDHIWWQKLLVLAVSYLLLGIATRQLNRHYADSFIKVFVAEQEAVTNAVREVLRRERLPYTMSFEDGRVRFLADRRRLSLTVEYFPLNLPVDMHLQTVPATKITLTPAQDVDRETIRRLRGELDRYIL